MQPELKQLLSRYHDGEVSPEEATEVESLLERDADAMAYLTSLDEMATAYRVVAEEQLSQVSFDGFWQRIETEIAAAPPVEQAVPSPGFGAQIANAFQSIFGAHKGAWAAASAAACTVALVMSFVGGPVTERVIERQIIVVESIDQLDQNNLVLVNSLKDDDTAVIWMLPNVQADDEEGHEDDLDDGDVVITDEAL